ncbi:MAG: hypothetical protein U1F71_18840 [Verrucomicrobiaceae bacterium]
MAGNNTYHLQWRGSKKGPLDLAAVKEALKSGDVHSMYQIEVDGQWQLLREFMDALHAREKEAARTTAQQAASMEPLQEGQRRPPPVPLRGQQRPFNTTTITRPAMIIDSSLRNSRNKRSVLVPQHSVLSRTGQNDEDMQPLMEADPSLPDYIVSSSRSGAGHMEWRHVGMAFLLLLSIVAAGFGSYAIVKVISAPAITSRSDR